MLNFKSFLNSPITRILIYLFLFIIIVPVLIYLPFTKFLGENALSDDTYQLIYYILDTIFFVAVYYFLVKIYEKREVFELSLKNFLKYFTTGFGIGTVLQILVVVVFYLFGAYKIISFNSVYYLLTSSTMGFSPGFEEEILFRGIILRNLEESLGSYIALIISAALFGLIHISNPGANWFVVLGISLSGGLLLGSAYIYSKSLWLPIGIHTAWNYIQFSLQGYRAGDEQSMTSFIVTKISGPEWLVGTGYGVNVTYLEIFLCLIVTFIFLYLAHKNNRIILPFWMKGK